MKSASFSIGCRLWLAFGVFALLIPFSVEASEKVVSSYAPVVIKEPFQKIMTRMEGEKTAIMKRQMELLNERYDLSDRPASGVTMSRGKPVHRVSVSNFPVA